VVLQNESGGAGRAQVQRLGPAAGQATTLLVENLSTLHDQEYQFSTPIILTAGQQLALVVSCQADQPACAVGMYYTGQFTQPATP
jgi:hypothetical protein